MNFISVCKSKAQILLVLVTLFFLTIGSQRTEAQFNVESYSSSSGLFVDIIWLPPSDGGPFIGVLYDGQGNSIPFPPNLVPGTRVGDQNAVNLECGQTVANYPFEVPPMICGFEKCSNGEIILLCFLNGVPTIGPITFGPRM